MPHGEAFHLRRVRRMFSNGGRKRQRQSTHRMCSPEMANRGTSLLYSIRTKIRSEMQSWSLSSSTAGVTRLGRGPRSLAWIATVLLGLWVTVRPPWPVATTSTSRKRTSLPGLESLWNTTRATLRKELQPRFQRRAMPFSRALFASGGIQSGIHAPDRGRAPLLRSSKIGRAPPSHSGSKTRGGWRIRIQTDANNQTTKKNRQNFNINVQNGEEVVQIGQKTAARWRGDDDGKVSGAYCTFSCTSKEG